MELCALDRRAVVLAAPAVVPLSMAAVFRAAARRTSPRVAYNLGFWLYWGGWCVAFPVWVTATGRGGVRRWAP